MRAVMDGDRYFYMAVAAIKQRDPGDYEKTITCESCGYEDTE